MQKRPVRFSPRFNQRFDELQATGRLNLVCAQALADAIAQPLLPDSAPEANAVVNWCHRSTNHLLRFIIFGSYVNNKPDPGDINIILIIDD